MTTPGTSTSTGAAVTITERLAAFAVEHTYERLPADVQRSVGQRVLDILGIAVRATELPSSAAVLDLLNDEGGHPQATAVLAPVRLPAAATAFYNGALAHSLDYDDTHMPSVLHPSASIVPACLAVAELTGASGAQLGAAVAVGLEICVRIGMAGFDDATRSSTYLERGQDATAMCGAIGAAAATAILRGLDEQRVMWSMGIAASMASGILEANRTGGTIKRLHCGLGAQSGVRASALAARGITGPPTALEGRLGFFQCFIQNDAHPELVCDGLGESWSVPGIFYKPYPANHFTHAGFDAACAIRRQGIAVDRIVAAHLGVPSQGFKVIGEPIDVKRSPPTGYQAQFSGPFTVALGLTADGAGLGMGMSDFTDERANDPALRALMRRITVGIDDRCQQIFPSQFPAVLTVTLDDGRVITEAVLVSRGGSANPLSDDELARKFHDNVDGLLSPVRAAAATDACHSLGELERVGDLMGLFAAP